MSSEAKTKPPPAAESDALAQSDNMKKQRFGFGFYMTLGLLVVGLSFSEPLAPPAGNILMIFVSAFCGLQAYLRQRSGLQRVSSFLLFAVGLGLFLSPLLASIYVEWLRR